MCNNIIIVSSFTSHCLFTDLPLSPDSPLLDDAADIDFGFDSGIEAEMDEPRGNVFYQCSVYVSLNIQLHPGYKY